MIGPFLQATQRGGAGHLAINTDGRLHQSKLAVGGPQQHDASVAGHAAAVKSTLHDSATELTKFDLARSNFFGTVWH